MSKKATSLESSPDNQTTKEVSDGVHQQEGDVQLASLSNMMLEDLPLELIHDIFIRAIAMEVEEMHLAKSVWKKKADLVRSRLKRVCTHWSNILTSNSFRNELDRTLDRTECTIRLEILHQFLIECYNVLEVLTLKDELFVLCEPQPDVFAVYVYDRNNAAEVKDIVALSEIDPHDMVGCSVSNCLYILNQKEDDVSVLRIVKENERQFGISPWISCSWKPTDLSVANNGSVILSRLHGTEPPAVIVIYDANGYLQFEMSLPSYLYAMSSIIPKSNGNFVLTSASRFGVGHRFCNELVEIDTNVTLVREYNCLIGGANSVCRADLHGSMLILETFRRIALLDDEFNRVNVITSHLDMDLFKVCSVVHYNSERNEFAVVLDHEDLSREWVACIFHFTEK